MKVQIQQNTLTCARRKRNTCKMASPSCLEEITVWVNIFSFVPNFSRTTQSEKCEVSCLWGTCPVPWYRPWWVFGIVAGICGKCQNSILSSILQQQRSWSTEWWSCGCTSAIQGKLTEVDIFTFCMHILTQKIVHNRFHYDGNWSSKFVIFCISLGQMSFKINNL